MSYILGAITLPNPKSLNRQFVETGAENLLIEGKTTKRVENRKEKFIMVFQDLTTAQANSILSEYELEEVRTFQVTEDNLSIGPTDVLIDVINRKYPLSGEAYRQNFDLVLTEVT